MKLRNIIFTVFLISIVFLSFQSISAENVTDICGDEIDMEFDDSNEILSSSSDDALSEISSDPLPNVETGVVSGGVDFTNAHPWAPTDAINGNRGNITYNVPSTASSIKSAYVYVNVYSGSGGTNYGAYSNTSIITADGVHQLGSEYLWISTSSQNGINYIVNDHTTRCYSDYMIFYNVTDMLQGLNGTPVTVDVLTYPMEGKSFDGRIKLVSLFVAWDDGDADEIYYWLNAGQAWTDDTENGISHTFENIADMEFSEKLSTLINVGISSADALYLIDGITFYSESDSDEYINGAYYQYHKWDVSQYMHSGTLEVGYKAISGAYGPSFKDIISILTIQDPPVYEADKAQISIIPEFYEIPCAYAGTNNTLTVKVTTKEGRYTVKLLADGIAVDEGEVDLNDGTNTLLLTDSTIRPVDESTVNGASNRKVNYTVEVSSKGSLINSSSVVLPVLYNGNLGKELEYPSETIRPFMNITVNGDIVIDIQNYSHYISASVLNRTEVWNVDLSANSSIVKSFIYIPYYEFNSRTYTEDVNMFDVTFNDASVIPVGLYRDQSNLGRSYYSGYGVLVYDVTGLIRNGENRLQLNKKFDTPAVYPSALIYMYNTTGSTSINEILICNGADLLEGISNNVAGRTVHTDSVMEVDSGLASRATLHVFAADAQSDEGSLIVNGNLYSNVWNETSSSYSVYSVDITDSLKDANDISFVATGYRIIALQQIMVLTKNLNDMAVSLESEYPDTCYAGTDNIITVSVQTLKDNRVIARLLTDGVKVNESEIDLVCGFNEFKLADPTIRPVDETTVSGASNRKVNYTLQLLSGEEVLKESSLVLNVLYNGYLGKDLAYPGDTIRPFMNITVTGGIVVDIKDASSYLDNFDMQRTDRWNINLDDKSSMVKALIYVPYELCNVNVLSEGIDMFNVRFNDNQITAAALYRDQSNLGQYGMYGYGLLVYDVTDYVKNGENSFALSKGLTPKVYPSALVYMYNTTGSNTITSVYISNGADLLSKDINRLSKADSTINADANVDSAKLYIFASSAQDGDGNIVFNGEAHDNVWSATASSTQSYVLDISDSIRDANEISFVATGDAILALQQMIVSSKAVPLNTKITAPSVTAVYNTNSNLVVTLKDSNGNAVSGASITVNLNGKPTVLNTDSKGQAKLVIPSNLVPKTYKATVSYDGDDKYVKSSATVNVVVKKASVKLTLPKKTYKAKVKTKKYAVTLKDNKGKVMKKVKLTLKVSGKIFKATTDAKGKATFKIINLKKKGKYTAKVTYNGDKYFNKVTKSVKITVKK